MLLQAQAGFKLGFCRFSRAIRMDLMICKVHIANHSDMGCLCWYTPVYFGPGSVVQARVLVPRYTVVFQLVIPTFILFHFSDFGFI